MTAFFTAIGNMIARVDTRAWFTVGIFALVWKVLDLIQADKTLLDSAPFMQFVGPIGGAGGLLLIASFFFGSNKESAQKSTALAANAVQMRDAGIPVGGTPAPEKKPVDVNVVNPYATKTDEELATLLKDRGEDPTNRTRDEMLAKLTELDANIPTEPR